MAHTYISNAVHCIFSTKNRVKSIKPEWQSELWAYMGGIAGGEKCMPISIGGVEDHVHLLLYLAGTISLSKLIQLIKGGSSKWAHEKFDRSKLFEWQEGFGGFSVSRSQIDATIRYIATQVEHHKRMSFEQEFFAILKKHGVVYDERYALG